MSAGGNPAFEVRLKSRRVQRELSSLKGSEYDRVYAVISLLADNPHPRNSEKLFENIYRVRAGMFRIIYMVNTDNHRVEIGAVRRRSEVTYKNITGLFR